MYNDIIGFYLEANKLKYGIRTGWGEVGITNKRLESFAEHIYGCIILSIILDSKKNLGLNMYKVIKMIIAKELRKLTLEKEITPVSTSSDEEISNNSYSAVKNIAAKFGLEDELVSLEEEFNVQQTPEAKFCSQILKIESDLQAKDYELRGEFPLEKALSDIKNFSEPLASEILPQVQKPSDGWILYDRQYYSDELFKDLSQEIQKL